MKLKSLYVGLTAVLLVCLGNFSILDAKSCKTFLVHGKGEGSTKIGARARAMSEWKENARAGYGAGWALWSKAKSKKVTCKKKKGDYKCHARAFPCE